METMPLDKYAKDAHAWWFSARIDYTASCRLFETQDLMMVFPAAVLGHIAIEKYLKAALICTGATICNPSRHKALIANGTLNKCDCAWGHDLLQLAAMLAERRGDFDLSLVLFDQYPLHEGQMTLNDSLKMFEPFHHELRYPITMSKFKSLGPTDVVVLISAIEAIARFAECGRAVSA